MPLQDNTPPFSRRRARDCTAGAFDTLANNSLAAAILKSCAKQEQRRRRTKSSQGGKPRVANACGLTYKSRVPELSRFFGIVIRMYAEAGAPHHEAHFHAYYHDSVGIYRVDPVDLIAGELPARQKRFVEAWAELHQEELLVDWNRLQGGERPLPIEPLK
jgi:Domain of unknown function (DUF4160)